MKKPIAEPVDPAPDGVCPENQRRHVKRQHQKRQKKPAALETHGQRGPESADHRQRGRADQKADREPEIAPRCEVQEKPENGGGQESSTYARIDESKAKNLTQRGSGKTHFDFTKGTPNEAGLRVFTHEFGGAVKEAFLWDYFDSPKTSGFQVTPRLPRRSGSSPP